MSSVESVTTPRLRPFLAKAAAYKPGRRPAPGQQLLRLASNETPHPLHPSVTAAISAAVTDGNRYPDPSVTQLTEALAAKHGIDPARVAVGCGSVQLVQELIGITCDAGDEVVFGWRSFEAYPQLSAIAGAVGVQVPLVAGHLDLPAMAAAVTDRTRLVLLCSPNNPTGPALSTTSVRAFLEAVRDDVLVVLDEAYAEFVDDPDAVDGTQLLDARDNLVVLRTFSKAYGLAGLRVGYALTGSPSVATALRQVHVPFTVSVAAQAAALASLRVEDELLKQVADIVAEREPLRQALLAQGWDVPEAQGNFVWLPSSDAERVSAVFEEHGILVRCFAGEGNRITVTTRADAERVLEAAQAAYL
ncbi:MAG: hisC [Frankiales bacterium]|nr:hisC [Frankiales bacterium]